MSTTEPMGPDDAPRRRDVQHAELDGEIVVYTDGAVHKLDRIASELWKRFDGTVMLGTLADELSAVYEGATRDEILHDIVACADALDRQGLLVHDEPPSGCKL